MMSIVQLPTLDRFIKFDVNKQSFTSGVSATV